MYEWCVQPDCGAVVLFSGTVRDHAPGRTGVEYLEYEAYIEHAVSKMADVVDEARRRWPDIGRVAMFHRLGRLAVGESTVIVAVSAPHRPESFAACRFCIDALKASVPIWKKEVWADGEDWGTNATELRAPSDVATDLAPIKGVV